ncbi:MAG: sialate O-acetylesterase [Kiritimatiellales bacterium]
MNKKSMGCCVLGCVFLAVSLAGADPVPPSVASPVSFKVSRMFGNDMVLQRGQKVPIFGTAPDGETVTVCFAGQSKSVTAQAGQWRVCLDELPADRTGNDLSVTCGGSQINFTNVVVGEVWYAGGQSNMGVQLWYAEKLPAMDTAFPAADHRGIRRFAVTLMTDPGQEDGGSWSVVTAANAGKMSAVCYYFADNLSAALDVPIGMIECHWGGTLIESWMNPALLTNSPELAYAVEARKAKQTLRPNDGQRTERNIPGILFEGMTAKVLPYGIKGMLWYQGEHNANAPELYPELLRSLVGDLRAQWGQGNFPFYIVQLPKFTNGNWPVMREAQMKASQMIPNADIVVTIDTGAVVENRTVDPMGPAHPRDKRPVGERLALLARAKTYAEKIVYSGPRVQSCKLIGSQVEISFDHTGSGLTALGAGLPGFEVCGEDRVFKSAEAVIVKDKVMVSGVEVPVPVMVRYAWSKAPELSLGNREGLPAFPFRIDIAKQSP